MANVVTNAGKGVITGRFLSLPLFISWGQGAGESAQTDVSLFSEAIEERADAAVAQATTDTANDTIQAVGTLVATGQRAITNAGLFDAATSGNLLMKGNFAVVNLNEGDSITFTLKIQFQ
jgi:Flp pilus assembly protein TadG